MKSGWRSAGKLAGLALVVAFSLGCTCRHPSFAPPARMMSGGMPAGYQMGGGEVRLGAGPALQQYGLCSEEAAVISGRVRIGLTHWAALEAGATAAFTLQTPVMGTLGGRFVVEGGEIFRLGLGLGFGIGTGGQRVLEQPVIGSGETVEPPVIAYGEGPAFAGYLDIDLGLRFFPYFAIFLANSVQVAGQREVPTTFWGLHALGFEVSYKALVVALEGGPAYYDNDVDSRVGGSIHFSIGARWGQVDI